MMQDRPRSPLWQVPLCCPHDDACSSKKTRGIGSDRQRRSLRSRWPNWKMSETILANRHADNYDAHARALLGNSKIRIRLFPLFFQRCLSRDIIGTFASLRITSVSLVEKCSHPAVRQTVRTFNFPRSH